MALFRRRLRLGLSQDGAITAAHTYFPSFLRQRDRAATYDSWTRGEQEGSLYVPDGANAEYGELMAKSPGAWGGLVIKSVVQNLELTGMRMADGETIVRGWEAWQRNNMDAKQAALYTGACGQGVAHVWGVLGTDPLTKKPMTRFRMASAQSMASFYSPDDDEWPEMAIHAEPLVDPVSTAAGVVDTIIGWSVMLLDDIYIYHLRCDSTDGSDLKSWTYVSQEAHGASVCPVVRYAPNLDIEGRANSDLQGMIPLLARIDQDVFDRLIVQRFGAWKIRWIAGMEVQGGPAAEERKKIQLRMESLLIANSKDTKFGTLDATDLKGFIEAGDTDLRTLAALSQTPPHHLLGVSANLQAESLAAAETGLQRKTRGHKIAFGESNEQLMRLDAHFRGDETEQAAFNMQAVWRDTESRSLEQAAMALGMLATNLKVPVEMLWERIPGWTELDTKRAKKLVEDGTFEKLLAELGGGNPNQPDPNQPDTQGQPQPVPSAAA